MDWHQVRFIEHSPCWTTMLGTGPQNNIHSYIYKNYIYRYIIFIFIYYIMCSYRYARQFPTIFSDICEGMSIETTKLLLVFPCFPPCLKGFRLRVYLTGAGSDSCSQSAAVFNLLHAQWKPYKKPLWLKIIGNYTIQYSLWQSNIGFWLFPKVNGGF
jgi:hypothetical protein